MQSTPQAVGAITLFVEDLAAAKAFYADVFGLPLTFEDANCAIYSFGPTMVNLLQVANAPRLIEPAVVGAAGTDTRAMFTIFVEDVDAECATLRERGVELLNGPITRPWHQRTIAFADPAGHVWEFAQNVD